MARRERGLTEGPINLCRARRLDSERRCDQVPGRQPTCPTLGRESSTASWIPSPTVGSRYEPSLALSLRSSSMTALTGVESYLRELHEMKDRRMELVEFEPETSYEIERVFAEFVDALRALGDFQ